ncbi:MAG: GH3 auxin-responsive promoter family protein [Chitinophagales bacterium]|nr:GH3 auxin-responsive promoter family protein [Saprospiraceae bacterium]MBK7110044.1 GH3 auxin-responsive promoter family protein [Bacteroidota bacterium]MBK8487232.1 GH3 auxin-responsive promoter family protein [Bacteroidota bacterium]MBK8680618.1 GH3 auxin-responsive promoter family protein [Bacteroidota bacterium]MBP8754362.1 GH3 auxin-responsive promoter family protein [Chitinophagales bacterium]
MSIKSSLARPFASYVASKIKSAHTKPIEHQKKIMLQLIAQAKDTAFGNANNFESVKTYSDFKQAVPIADYEALKPWIEKIKQGEQNILWPGKPLYFAKTSGTTSGVKYIPITKASMPNHINSARNALLMYINNSGNTDFVNGKMIFLQGSPEVEELHGIKIGRLSGLVYHHVPGYLLKNRLPSYQTNCIEDWEEKVEKICRETIKENMTLISGIPPWVIMYFEKLLEISGKKTVKEIFPNFSLFVYGGVNYEPYRMRMEELIGGKIDSIETYPASEGFIAYQDSLTEPGLLLNVDSGIFFEFIPVEEVHLENPTRISLESVELDKNYALVINSNAGLWGYFIGDTVKFVSLNPHRIIVSGRVKHFISAFGEHVIGEEVEFAILEAAKKMQITIREFTVAPQVNPTEGLPYHEWFVEFEKNPEDIDAFTVLVDENLQKKNIYYRDLIEGKILRPLIITLMQPNAFRDFMKSKGKLGGQNKVARLSNDRIIANELDSWKAC